MMLQMSSGADVAPIWVALGREPEFHDHIKWKFYAAFVSGGNHPPSLSLLVAVQCPILFVSSLLHEYPNMCSSRWIINSWASFFSCADVRTQISQMDI
jgi:hypothetical protein